MKITDDNKGTSSKIAPIFLAAAAKQQHGSWKIQPEQLMVYTSQDIKHRPKIAGFDLDGTLIKTKSGHVFATNTDDWQFWSRDVVAKLRKYHDQGFKLCIFSNQKGIQTKQVNAGDFKRKIQNICTAIGIPIQVFISIGTLNYRKPYIGMWTRLEEQENDGIQVDRRESFYVGDAAGRIKGTGTREKADHSCADRLFALNLGLKFHTPEQFFSNKTAEEPYELPRFNPAQFLQEAVRKPLLEPPDAKIPGASLPELLISVGPQACGKSTFARKYCHKYTILSQDVLGTWKRCVAEAKRALEDGQSVIIDNTNRDVETRKRYLDLASSLGVQCRCLLFNCSHSNALHNNIFRKIVGHADAAHRTVNESALRSFFSAYKEPQMSEGFAQIVRVNFVPEFQNEEERRIYGLYLTEKVN